MIWMQQMTSSFPTPVFSNAGRGWKGIELLQFKGTVEEIATPSFPFHAVVIGVSRPPVDVVQRLNGKLYENRFHRGESNIVPAGTSAEVGYRERVEGEVINLHLEDAFLREVAQSVEVDPDSLEIILSVSTQDPQIERIGLSLKAEAEADGLVGSKLYAESLANALAISLIRDHSSLGRKVAKKATAAHTGGLSKRALREAIDYVGDNIANKGLTLADIADAAHMSPYHFSRLFKESTGLAPHQYVIEQRLKRARVLLGSTALPIAEIALLCGFANQSHLNRHLKRLFDVSAKALR
jgi:AraC family transcriptional regulator